MSDHHKAIAGVRRTALGWQPFVRVYDASGFYTRYEWDFNGLPRSADAYVNRSDAEAASCRMLAALNYLEA